jgi:hypothetical protein
MAIFPRRIHNLCPFTLLLVVLGPSANANADFAASWKAATAPKSVAAVKVKKEPKTKAIVHNATAADDAEEEEEEEEKPIEEENATAEDDEADTPKDGDIYKL